MYGTIYVYVHICRKNVVSIQCLTRIIGDNMYIYISIQYIHPEIYYGYPKSPYYHLIIFCQTSFFDICMCYVENTQLHGVYLWDTFDLARSWLKLYKPSYQPTRPWGGRTSLSIPSTVWLKGFEQLKLEANLAGYTVGGSEIPRPTTWDA